MAPLTPPLLKRSSALRLQPSPRLDIDSLGHGIETVTVKHVGTQANRTNLTNNRLASRQDQGPQRERFRRGRQVDHWQRGQPRAGHYYCSRYWRPMGTGIGDFTPVLQQAHINTELIVALEPGIDLVAPLKFNHASEPSVRRSRTHHLQAGDGFHSRRSPSSRWEPASPSIVRWLPVMPSTRLSVTPRSRPRATKELLLSNQWSGGPARPQVSASSFTATPPTLTAGA